MKILHIAKYYHPFRGGIEKVIKELSEGSVNQRHEVVVLSSSHDNTKKVEFINGVKVVRLPRFGIAYSQPLTLSLFWELSHYLQWADVVHLHTPNPLAELALVTKPMDKPLVTTYHCEVVRQRRLKTFYLPVARQVLARSQKIVVATPKHLEHSELLQPFASKCAVIPFGVEAKFAKKSLGVNTHLNRIKEQFGEYFLFIGRLVPYKGVDVLLRAMATTDKNLLCIGVGPRWEQWNAQVAELGLGKRVKFLGQIEEDEELAAYIHGSTSIVLPSVDESEAFGIVLIEAMACGKPVITTRLNSGVSWVNEAGVTGIEVPPRAHEPLAQAIQMMAENKEMRMAMGEAARRRFTSTFQLQQMIDSYEHLYLETVASRKIAA